MNKCQLLFNTFGLFLDFVGVSLFIIIPLMTKGAATAVDEAFLLEQRFGRLIASCWSSIAIVLIAIGFLAQILGNIIALLN